MTAASRFSNNSFRRICLDAASGADASLSTAWVQGACVTWGEGGGTLACMDSGRLTLVLALSFVPGYW